MAIVLRLNKNSALTYEELDGNFADLDSRLTPIESRVGPWNEAYNWGNHALVGYLTFYEESDPVFTASVAYNITQQNITNWGQAFNWGDHAAENYLKNISAESLGSLQDVDLTAAPNVDDILKWNGTAWVAGDGTEFPETDPVFTASPAAGIGNTEISNWNTAYSWGDHSTEGYLRASSPAASVTNETIINWNTAYNWGNHATAGYLTSAPAVTISDSSPLTPTQGDLWWQSDTGVLKIYYNDGTSVQWVDATPAAGYTLPEASNTTLGGVTVDNTTITATLGEISAVGISSNSSSILIGDLTLGLSSYTNTLHIDGTGSNANFIAITGHYIPTTNATWDIGSAEYKVRDLYLSSASDERLKHNITPFYNGLDFVRMLKPVDFTWNSDVQNKAGKRQTGFIAQEVAAALKVSDYNSWLLHDDQGMYQGLDQTQLIPALVSAIKELDSKIRQLEGLIEESANGN
jgi:hypothetical protein